MDQFILPRSLQRNGPSYISQSSIGIRPREIHNFSAVFFPKKTLLRPRPDKDAMNYSSDLKDDGSLQSGASPSDCSSGRSMSNALNAEKPGDISVEMFEIYSENVLAKLLRVAQEALENNVS